MFDERLSCSERHRYGARLLRQQSVHGGHTFHSNEPQGFRKQTSLKSSTSLTSIIEYAAPPRRPYPH